MKKNRKKTETAKREIAVLAISDPGQNTLRKCDVKNILSTFLTNLHQHTDLYPDSFIKHYNFKTNIRVQSHGISEEFATLIIVDSSKIEEGIPPKCMSCMDGKPRKSVDSTDLNCRICAMLAIHGVGYLEGKRAAIFEIIEQSEENNNLANKVVN